MLYLHKEEKKTLQENLSILTKKKQKKKHYERITNAWISDIGLAVQVEEEAILHSSASGGHVSLEDTNSSERC